LLVFSLSLTLGWATPITNQGSTATSRNTLDVSTGLVVIYNGGFFPSGETINQFSWFGPTFSGSLDLTPLIFTDTNGIFTVVGIGTPQTVNFTGSPQTFDFGVIAGTDVTSGSNFTFGFVTGLALPGGTLSGTSKGSVGVDLTVDGGTGVGGAGTTNDWVFTPGTAGVTVGLGTTFEIPGSNGTVGSTNFLLNNPSKGGFLVDRTYSANADQASGVAEPGTFSLITGAGLVLAGLFRYRSSRGRRS
jgi:hypothetical protein